MSCFPKSSCNRLRDLSTRNSLLSNIWNISYIKLRILKLSEPWSSQLWTQFKKSCTEARQNQDSNGVWTRDLAILVRRSNQLSYEATEVGNFSLAVSIKTVRNEYKVLYEIFHILNCGFWSQVSYNHRSYECNSSNCV